MAGNAVQIIVQDVPDALQAKLVADAQQKETPVADRALDILCQHFRVPYAPSTRGYTAVTSTSRLLFSRRVPERLRTKLNMEAAKVGGTQRGVILKILSEHYGLPAVSPRRRPRTVTRA
jgi:hypothetical protein